MQGQRSNKRSNEIYTWNVWTRGKLWMNDNVILSFTLLLNRHGTKTRNYTEN